MAMALEAFRNHWRNFDFSKQPAIHPDDVAALKKSDKFNLSLPPYPFVGDLRSADIWLLMINSKPGAHDAA